MKAFRYRRGRPLRRLRAVGSAALLLAVCVMPGVARAASSPPDFVCGGRVEQDVWRLWDDAGRRFQHETMIVERLGRQHDAYALYDMQDYLQNLAAMAARCARHDRLLELANLVAETYDFLEPIPEERGGGTGWICRGGPVCHPDSRLHGTEVRLDSQQFLVLATMLAHSLAADGPLDEATARFVDRTFEIAIDHLDRWNRGSDPLRLAARRRAKPVDVKSGSSALFFTDADLWSLALYANVAGIAERRDLADTAAFARRHRATVSGLLRLFAARTTRTELFVPGAGRIRGADLDRGFWRRYADNRYAGYRDDTPPVVCERGDGSKPTVRVPADTVGLDDSVGWDFGHARRLVHFAAAVDASRAAMRRVYDLPATAMPPRQLARRYAAQLLGALWNGDVDRPLFANYWSGANGWYRVAYDNGTGRCVAGYAPSMLSDTFATGGFIVWQSQYALIGRLGRSLYDAADGDEARRAFIASYYPGLGASASRNNRMLTQLMFWPTLVHAGKES